MRTHQSAPSHAAAAHPPRRAAAPPRALEGPERRAAEAAVRRLQGALKAAISAVPAGERRVRALAAYLRIDESVAQRTLAGVQPEQPEIRTLLRVPGVDGLRLVHAALSRRGVRPGALSQLRGAIDQFESLIADLAGSHARLRARVEATLADAGAGRPGSPHAPDETARKGLYEYAAELLGTSMDAATATIIMGPGGTDRVVGLSVTGNLGVRSRPGGLPLALTFADRLDPRDGPGGELGPVGPGQQVLEGGSLLTAFSSSPLPAVTHRAAATANAQIVDPAAFAAGAVDAVVASRRGAAPSPRVQATPVQSMVKHLRTPARRMVMDVWVHRSLLPVRAPAAGVFLYQPGMPIDPAQSWYNRLPGGPVPMLLGEGLANAPSDTWARHAELTAFAFGCLDADAGAYTGFRLDVQYPVWNAAYTLWLDYADDSDG